MNYNSDMSDYQTICKASELTEKLMLGRNIESFLDRAAEYDRRMADRM